MAKRKPASPDASPKSLAELRREVDALDRQLVELLNQRAERVIEIGRLKTDENLEPYDPTRERKILTQLAEANAGPLTSSAVQAIFREVISGCRSLAVPQRIAYLGPEYSYSHIAAMHRFGQAAELIPVGTIAAVFEEVTSGQAQFGLVPMENSTDGRIADTLTMFARTPMRICGEVQLRIHHNLLGRGSRNDVREVYSKPQALSQCRDWLAKHLPQAALRETTSTTAAAEIAAQKSGAAAVASRQAGVNYGLDVLAPNIEDNANNVTRFAVIGQQAHARTKNDKTAVMFQVEHKPGALADAMNLFKRHRLNLTWIESFPIPGVPSEYLFFVELEGHEHEPRVKKCLALLAKKAVRLEVLGSYEKREIVDS
jgi:chorismate mutase/prephenate dehydratase